MNIQCIKAILSVLEYAEEAGYGNFDSDTCKKQAGNYWAEIKEELQKRNIFAPYINDRVGLIDVNKIPALKAEFQNMLKKCQQENHDRKLRNAGTWFAILASIVAIIEATIAIIKVYSAG